MSTTELLRDILTELRGLRADLRRQHAAADARAALVAAIASYFGPGTFTAGGLIQIAREEPHSDLAVAIERVVDLDSERPAIALGRLLARMPELDAVGGRRGATLFRLVQG